jgi:ribosomal protein S18 acetylase RimI-like enzyme
MPLPILKVVSSPTAETLIRYFHQTEREWSRHLAEDETTLDAGVAISNRQLAHVWDANGVLDASLPDGAAPADAVAEVEAHFAAIGCRCRRWVMNPSADPARTRPLVEHLLAGGWKPMTLDVMRLQTAPLGDTADAPGLTIIPARASYRHARELAEREAAVWNEPTLADAAILHVEDPHVDTLLALKDGAAVASVSVLAVGEIGRIDNVFVAEHHRRNGIGRTMMSRAMELCARSLFKHVLLAVLPGNAPGIALYRAFGFKKIGEVTFYRAA